MRGETVITFGLKVEATLRGAEGDVELAEAAATAQALAELLRFARPEDRAAIAALDREQGSALATLWSGFRQEEPVNAI